MPSIDLSNFFVVCINVTVTFFTQRDSRHDGFLRPIKLVVAVMRHASSFLKRVSIYSLRQNCVIFGGFITHSELSVKGTNYFFK